MTYHVREPISDSAGRELGEYPELVRHLLYYRGIADAGPARNFLNPDYKKHVHDPFLMKGMETAVARVLKAIAANEKMVVYSDYDADGVPGGVLMYDFFKRIGHKNFTSYIPHRHDEGFGLNHDAIESFAHDGVKLMITVDCGIADVAEVARARVLGIETIITDHHLPGPDGIPDAVAVLDPKQESCPYPFKELCGTGVAFKLVQGLIARGGFSLAEGWEKWLLDLVALATLSDMVPLIGENRALAHFGLLVLRKSPRPGLQRLLRKAQVDQKSLTEDDVVFSVTPKLNAASRMGSADAAFKLLSTTDELDADFAVEELWRLNDERKGIVGSLVREIKKMLQARTPSAVIVAGNPAWRPSLLGLAANSLLKEHARPVFLWGRDGDDQLKGSCRSDGSVSVMDIMTEARTAFVEYGGHAFSGGFTIVPEQVHTLEERLSAACMKVGANGSGTQALLADSRFAPDEVTGENYEVIQKLAPFGQGNPKPIFLFENVTVKSARMFGKERNHLEIQLPKKDGKNVKAIKFFAEGEGARVPKSGARLSLLASLEKSSFGGRTELRLRIVDFV